MHTALTPSPQAQLLFEPLARWRFIFERPFAYDCLKLQLPTPNSALLTWTSQNASVSPHERSSLTLEVPPSVLEARTPWELHSELSDAFIAAKGHTERHHLLSPFLNTLFKQNYRLSSARFCSVPDGTAEFALADAASFHHCTLNGHLTLKASRLDFTNVRVSNGKLLITTQGGRWSQCHFSGSVTQIEGDLGKTEIDADCVFDHCCVLASCKNVTLLGPDIAKRFQGTTFDFDAVPPSLKATMRQIAPEEYKKRKEAREKATWGKAPSVLNGSTGDRLSP